MGNKVGLAISAAMGLSISIVAVAAPPAKNKPAAAKPEVVFFDPLDSLNAVTVKSPGWALDKVNQQYLAGDGSRAVRVKNTKEYLMYRFHGATGFIVRVFSKSDPSKLPAGVQIYTSADSGKTTGLVDCAVLRTIPGGGDGGWTGYDLIPQAPLPSGTDSVYVLVNPVTDLNYDFEVSQVSILAPKTSP